jgi:hypothetical protein
MMGDFSPRYSPKSSIKIIKNLAHRPLAKRGHLRTMPELPTTTHFRRPRDISQYPQAPLTSPTPTIPLTSRLRYFATQSLRHHLSIPVPPTRPTHRRPRLSAITYSTTLAIPRTYIISPWLITHLAQNVHCINRFTRCPPAGADRKPDANSRSLRREVVVILEP